MNMIDGDADALGCFRLSRYVVSSTSVRFWDDGDGPPGGAGTCGAYRI